MEPASFTPGFDSPASAEDVVKAITHAAHRLPDQGPLSVFIHHNTLHAYQSEPFDQALAHAFRELGGEPYLSEEELRAELASGRITREDILEVVGPQDRSADPFLDAARIRLDLLYFGTDAQTKETLRFLDAELRVSTRLPSGIEAAERRHLIEASIEPLRAACARGDLTGLLRMLSPLEDPSEAAFDIAKSLGVRARLRELSIALLQNPEPFAARSLYSACVRRFDRPTSTPPASTKTPSHRVALMRLGGPDVASLIDPTFIRLVACYLDAGLAYWPMPMRDIGLWPAFSILYSTTFGMPPTKYFKTARERLVNVVGLEPGHVIASLLEDLGVHRGGLEEYLGEILLELPGWAGMFSRLERRPAELPASSPRPSLVEFVAVRLFLCTCALEEGARRLPRPLSLRELRAAGRASEPEPRDTPSLGYAAFQTLARFGVCGREVEDASDLQIEAFAATWKACSSLERRRWLQLAYERHYEREFMEAFATRAKSTSSRPVSPVVQLVFCIDDREESTRRHVEECLGERVETFGAPGFFGLAISYRGIDDADYVPSCPILASPTHVVQELVSESATSTLAVREERRRAGALVAHGVTHGSRGLARGIVSSMVLGPAASVPLILRTFWPRAFGRFVDSTEAQLLPRPKTELTAFFDEHTVRPMDPLRRAPGLPRGFTVEEAAARIAAFLENIGLTQDFAPLVVLVGHGSSSVNNPHQSAYQCGACGGRPGGPNARLFAVLANDRRVRDLLRSRGIEIPDRTWFLGTMHDTAADALDPLDLDAAPDEAQQTFVSIRPELDRALERQAHERSRKFERVPLDTPASATKEHVEERTHHLAEPRPEYNHSTNAACVVGPRELTRGLFLDRRSFLVSYDPSSDPEGTKLERVLAAALPVCAGINLEYYFSRVDNERYGSGTKLPHNVAGLIGVMNGHSSDLRTGLWKQTVEIHEPMRLLVVVAARPKTLLEIFDRQEEVRELVENAWVRLWSYDMASRSFQRFDPAEKRFVGRELREIDVPAVDSSAAWYANKRGPLPPALIKRPAEARDER
ncbi:MAG: DUF2309 domain-containing protein [Deltaproteobacteria bacterium]|nr:DUF2309 domain-containing protein [Deltaproteobacteria bacterium]